MKSPDISSMIPIDVPTTTLQQDVLVDVPVDVPNEVFPQSVPTEIATTQSHRPTQIGRASCRERV